MWTKLKRDSGVWRIQWPKIKQNEQLCCGEVMAAITRVENDWKQFYYLMLMMMMIISSVLRLRINNNFDSISLEMVQHVRPSIPTIYCTFHHLLSSCWVNFQYNLKWTSTVHAWNIHFIWRSRRSTIAAEFHKFVTMKYILWIVRETFGPY